MELVPSAERHPDTIAEELNDRVRVVPGFLTPHQVFTKRYNDDVATPARTLLLTPKKSAFHDYPWTIAGMTYFSVVINARIAMAYPIARAAIASQRPL